jgi:hypothetical protein
MEMHPYYAEAVQDETAVAVSWHAFVYMVFDFSKGRHFAVYSRNLFPKSFFKLSHQFQSGSLASTQYATRANGMTDSTPSGASCASLIADP